MQPKTNSSIVQSRFCSRLSHRRHPKPPWTAEREPRVEKKHTETCLSEEKKTGTLLAWSGHHHRRPPTSCYPSVLGLRPESQRPSDDDQLRLRRGGFRKCAISTERGDFKVASPQNLWDLHASWQTTCLLICVLLDNFSIRVFFSNAENEEDLNERLGLLKIGIP